MLFRPDASSGLDLDHRGACLICMLQFLGGHVLYCRATRFSAIAVLPNYISIQSVDELGKEILLTLNISSIMTDLRNGFIAYEFTVLISVSSSKLGDPGHVDNTTRGSVWCVYLFVTPISCFSHVTIIFIIPLQDPAL